jgi:membrane protein YdbS with pleckstrin-like domain
MKKMILPLIFALLFITSVIFYAIAVLLTPYPLLLKWGFGIIILIVAITMVFVFIQRVKEFKEEEKDDLSKY